MITKPKLNTKDTAGVIGQPTYAGGTTIISTKTASVTGATGLNQKYSHEDKGAKWERPRAHSTHPKAAKQYAKHG